MHRIRTFRFYCKSELAKKLDCPLMTVIELSQYQDQNKSQSCFQNKKLNIFLLWPCAQVLLQNKEQHYVYMYCNRKHCYIPKNNVLGYFYHTVFSIIFEGFLWINFKQTDFFYFMYLISYFKISNYLYTECSILFIQCQITQTVVLMRFIS